MTRIIADISVSHDGFVTRPDPGPYRSPDDGLGTGGAARHTSGGARTLVQRSVLSTSTAKHLTYDVSRVIR